VAFLELSNVSKKYAEFTAVQPLDLDVESHKTYALIGPSGCGKSTVLKLAIGLLQADTGTVHIDGELVSETNVEMLRQRIGYVIQDGGLFPHMTARHNACVMAQYLDWEGQRIEARLEQLSELVRLPKNLLERYPIQLSGGQRQRVSLMRALMLDPDLLLMDEPLGALDPMIRRDLQVDLRQIFRELDKTVVMVTHDLNEAAYFSDEVILMRDGRVVQRGAIENLMDAPADEFVTRFIRAQQSTLAGDAS
jgi:osmoprotectant transport system ATP-binding protein